jgi:hypothetical protein
MPWHDIYIFLAVKISISHGNFALNGHAYNAKPQSCENPYIFSNKVLKFILFSKIAAIGTVFST